MTERTIKLTDPRALRAVAHPTRLALVGLLRREGPMTATEAGETIGESAASCSFHLRQLAKYGLVEEAGAAEVGDEHQAPAARLTVGPGARVQGEQEVRRQADGGEEPHLRGAGVERQDREQRYGEEGDLVAEQGDRLAAPESPEVAVAPEELWHDVPPQPH